MKVSSKGYSYLIFHFEILKGLLIYSTIFCLSYVIFLLTQERLKYQNLPFQNSDLENCLVVFLAVILTLTMVSTLQRIRHRVQSIHLNFVPLALDYEESDFENDKLAAKTLLVSGLQDFDLSGDRFKQFIKVQTGKTLDQLKVSAFTTLPSLQTPYSYFLQKNQLTFLNKLHSKNQLNCLAKFLLPEKIKNPQIFALKTLKLSKKIAAQFVDQPENSGYAFLLFRDLAAISDFKHLVRKFPQKCPVSQKTQPLYQPTFSS